jgi:hypothetical protein
MAARTTLHTSVAGSRPARAHDDTLFAVRSGRAHWRAIMSGMNHPIVAWHCN